MSLGKDLSLRSKLKANMNCVAALGSDLLLMLISR
jgi:hypothetical protein